MNNSPLYFTSNPLRYAIGKQSYISMAKKAVNISISHESLHQEDISIRHYHATVPTFLFALDGELSLKHQFKDVLLKKNQGCWLPCDNTTTTTLLSPTVKIAVLQFPAIRKPAKQTTQFTNRYYDAVIPNTSKSGVTTWSIYQAKNGIISIILYPAHYKETPYYYKNTNQFLLSLVGEFALSINKQPFSICPKTGKFLPKTTRKALFNYNNDSIYVVNVITPYPIKDRVFAL